MRKFVRAILDDPEELYSILFWIILVPLAVLITLYVTFHWHVLWVTGAVGAVLILSPFCFGPKPRWPLAICLSGVMIECFVTFRLLAATLERDSQWLAFVTHSQPLFGGIAIGLFVYGLFDYRRYRRGSY